ncbi:bet1-like SNARE 1-1 [Gossypium australe]|uniref:Bet1-like SNARE 1-1 n=1 Tax=Gossypium australe TaxID=47621 RepID=A0A5B6UYW2_9ROSI|nr:bet1-like SNARE 1-1 [Gossypium australe]
MNPRRACDRSSIKVRFGCRDMRNSRVALFDGIEEGGIRASSSYSHEIDEHENERAMEGLQDRVNLLKRLSGDIHEEVDSHNRMLDRMLMLVYGTWFACREMIWMHLREYSQELWTSLRWYLRPNQAEECLHWWHLLWLFSLSYTILLSNWSTVFLIQLRTLCDNL